MLSGLGALFLAVPLFLAALPATTNYELNSYGFGSGGTANSTTSNYALEGLTGEVSGQTGTTTNYNLKPGFNETQQANVPLVTLSNPSNYYDKLKFVIDEQGNPSDALYALQVCDVPFTAGTLACGGTTTYVKSDDTLGSTLTLTDYQTYTAWGGAGGANIIGLPSNTTYYIHAKATQGKYTESGYGPSSSASTIGQSISFCLYTGASCGLGSNSVAFGNINVNSINTSPNNIGTDFATNADFGGSVYIYSQNGGLKSTSTGYNITSATANLAAVPEGFGGQIASIGQVSGGTFTAQSPFNGSANNVGLLATTVSTLASVSSPIVGGHAATQLQVKPASIAKAQSDYSEILTLIAAASF
jgi:hypothetical protein